MAHPYSKHAATKSSRERIKVFQDGGAVTDEQIKKAREHMGSFLNPKTNPNRSYLQRSMNEAKYISDVVPRGPSRNQINPGRGSPSEFIDAAKRTWRSITGQD